MGKASRVEQHKGRQTEKPREEPKPNPERTTRLFQVRVEKTQNEPKVNTRG